MAGAEQVVILERLIKTGKEQVLVIVHECVSNLCPEVLQHINLAENGLLAHRLIL